MEERSILRIQAGHPETSGYKDEVTNWTLVGLEELLEKLPQFDTEQSAREPRLLWE